MDELDEIQDIIDLRRVFQRRKRRIFIHRGDPYQDLNEQDFLSRYRLSKEAFQSLFEQIRHRLPSSRDRRGLPISPTLQLLVGLRYLATGNFQMTIADTANMSQKSVSTIIRRVAAALTEIAPLYIKFPLPEEEAAVMQAFSIYANMPDCIGCIDGTLIPIRHPGGPDAEVYRCHKDYFALNVMGVCDASLKFTTLVVNWPGSTHDSRIFNESTLCHQLQHMSYKGFLLGDSEYACSSYLLTPFQNPATQKERNYNVSHIKTRNCIERAICVWKQRFAVLATPVRTKLEVTQNIITATAVLHNIAIENNLIINDNIIIDPQDDAIVNQQATQHVQRRAEIVESF